MVGLHGKNMEKGIITCYYPISPSTPLLRVVNYSCAHVTSLESSKARSGNKVEGATSLILQSNVNKDNNHFNFLTSSRPESMIDSDLQD